MDGVDTLDDVDTDDEVESELDDDTLKQEKFGVNSTEYGAVQYYLQGGSSF